METLAENRLIKMLRDVSLEVYIKRNVESKLSVTK